MTPRVAIPVLVLLCGCAGAPEPSVSGAGGVSGASGTPAGMSGTAGSGAAGAAGVSAGGTANSAGGLAGGGSGSVAQAGALGDGGTPSNGGALGSAGFGGGTAGTTGENGLPPRASVIEALRRANAYFVAKWPDPAKAIDSSHPSHIWTRAVYYEGLLGLYGVDPKPSDLSYAVAWGTSHNWALNTGITTRNGDNQCAGQTYLDLYLISPQPPRMIEDIKANIDRVV